MKRPQKTCQFLLCSLSLSPHHHRHQSPPGSARAPGLAFSITLRRCPERKRERRAPIWWGGQARHGMAWASDMNIICSSHCTVCTVRLRSPPRTHPRPVPAAKICPKDHEFSCRPVRKFRQLRVKRQLQDDGPALAAATSSTHTWHQLPAPASGYQQLAFHSTVRPQQSIIHDHATERTQIGSTRS